MAAKTKSKPGYKTSEFWMNSGAILVSMLLASDVIPTGSIWSQMAGIATAVLTTMGYTVSRTLLKK